MNLQSRRKHPLVFVEDVASPALTEADERHLRSSLRMGDGDLITVCDGLGTYAFVRLGFLAEKYADVWFEEMSATPLAVGFTAVKAHKPEWMVQKLTELGVDRIQPLVSDRAVVRWDAKKRKALHSRMVNAAREAAMQCRRVYLPEVSEVATVLEVLAAEKDLGTVVALADPDGEPLQDCATFVLVGPEGGWSDREIESASLVGLAGNVLRAETAVVVAGATLHGLRAGLFKA